MGQLLVAPRLRYRPGGNAGARGLRGLLAAELRGTSVIGRHRDKVNGVLHLGAAARQPVHSWHMLQRGACLPQKREHVGVAAHQLPASSRSAVA